MFLFWAITAFVTGAVIGSFLNVIIFRYSKDSMSIIKPERSVCPKCGGEIAWYDNVPILSFILLQGRCRQCQARISARYILVESLTAMVFLLNTIVLREPLEIIGACIIASSLIVVFFIDLDTYTISDWNSLFVLAGGILILLQRGAWMRNIITGLIALGLMALLYFLSKKGIGMGDVILIGASAFAVGPFGIILSVFIASLLGLLFALLTRKSFKSKVPFGPFLAIGIYCSILLEGYVSQWLETVYFVSF